MHSIVGARFLPPNAYKSLVGLPLGVALSSIASEGMITITFRGFSTPLRFLSKIR